MSTLTHPIATGESAGAVSPVRKRRRTQRERSEATQGRLLDATVASLVDLGYVGTTTTEVAQRAGVSRGAQLHHFPTKAQLVTRAIEHLAARFAEELRAEAGGLADDETRLAGATRLLWKVFAGPLGLAALELRVAARTDAELRERLRAVNDGLDTLRRKTCRQLFGVPTEGEAPAFDRAIKLSLCLMRGMTVEQVAGAAAEESALLAMVERMVATAIAEDAAAGRA